MKNKPVRHKELNTFKFQPFAERISNIDIDIFHKVGHEYENETDEEQSYFYRAIENWSILNLTEGFDAFKKEIKFHTLITLPQLILEKDRVVEVLLKHLKLKNVLCLQPLLDIVVAVAKDLRKDFYPYYKEFLAVLIELLNTKDTEQLEWVFTCLAYIFKFLWRPVIKDITSVFNALLPLLSSHKPEYINSFAAESFAFIARKVKDRQTFLLHILKTVKSSKDGVEGCGKLFFEVLHGVKGQFHSCAETVLPFLIESLSDSKFPQAVLFEILEQIVGNIAANIEPQKSNLLWTTLLATLQNLENNWKNSPDAKTSGEIELVLKLLGQSIEYRQGKLLQNPLLVVQLIVKLLSNEELPHSVLLTCTQIGILLLLSKNVRLSQEQASGVTRKILSLPQSAVLLYFVDNVSTFSSFEALVLPTFLKKCVINELSLEYFYVLTQLILKKSPLAESGVGLSNWKKYPIDFSSKDNNSKIEKILLEFLTAPNFDSPSEYICALICLPHINLTNHEQFEENLNANVLELIKKIDDEHKNENKSKVKQLLFILNNTLECSIHLGKSQHLVEKFKPLLEALLLLASNEEYLCALKLIDLLITALKNKETVINIAVLTEIDEVLAPNFSSPYHELRLLTAHLYTFFENLHEFDLKHSPDPDVPKEKWSVFTICFRVESIDSQVQTYRDQIQNLEKFNFDKPQMLMCQQTRFKTLPLRYLCGTLYINFKLLWDPVIDIIDSHAQDLDINDFWGIYSKELKGVVVNIREGKEHEIDLLPTSCPFIGDLYQNSQKFKLKPDFVNYRLLLWKAMSRFPDVAEARTRDVSELLLDFVEKEYTRNNSDIAAMWNIKQNASPEFLEKTTVEDNEDDEPKDEEQPAVKPRKVGGRANMKALLNFLAVFSKVRSPKSMYRESELSKLYFDLLQNKSEEVQKIALDCIMTYKHKYLVPYKENLYNLVGDKKFKNELVNFQLDKDASSIQRDHRENLIPFVMRIVFSKMSAKIGLRTGGKSSGQLRRNLVLRFLAGCEENEMLSFIKMTFGYYAKYIDEDPEAMVEKLSSEVNLEKFIPPKRLLSTVNFLKVILDEFGGLMGNELLTFVLQVVLVIGAVVKGALQQVSNVHAGYLATLRNLRTSTVRIVERFFGQFDGYSWKNKQINAIFKVFVWPYLDKLNVEGTYSPTSLLKLFVQWGSNPRYFPLLCKHDGDETRFILPQVIKLLLNEKSHITVVNAIEGMIEKLLTLQADEEDLQQVIPIDNLLPIQKHILDQVKLDDKLNYGSCILLPHVPSILEKIRRKLASKSKNLNQTELFILSRISELVWEAEISDDTLKLLLPIVLKRCTTGAGEEIVTQLLTTVKNLVGNVANPQLHLKLISPLFSEVSYASCRRLLTQILKSTCGACDSLKIGSELIDGLNAWDAKWVDQPDFQIRHDTFKSIQNALDDDTIDAQVGVLLIHNCYFLLRSEKDMSLRENASHCLRTLCLHLIKKYRIGKELDYILNETLFALIRSGMKNKNNDFRNDCISLLGHLARECPEAHPVLRDLHKYTNKADLEVDFFENITHLQLHRHARALLKFCQITRELTSSPNIRTLTQFVLPFASFYLCFEKYTSKNSVIDAAIECIGTICRILPWHQYEGLLKFYLGELRRKSDYQRQLVRVNVAILDAFHFDLSKGELSKSVEDAAQEVVNKRNEVSEENGGSDGIVGSSKVDETVEQVDKETPATKDDLQVDEVLDLGEGEDENGDEDLDEGEEEEVEKVLIKITEKSTLLCKSTATRVTRTIRMVLLPQLHRALAEMTQHDSSHKVNRRRTGIEREEEDLSRVPISLALVKLLQRLPKEILEANLPGIFMKMCTFLKSHLESVRRTTRETLQKIMQTLGPEYLHVMLREMTPLLNRGYQVHVLVFTTHAVLSCLREFYKPGDMDKIVLSVLDLCKADLFGSLAEEREVAKIAVKTSEAKSTKSFDTFQILAQYVSDKCLMDLLLPIKNVLQASHSFKTNHKVQECLRHIALGLVDNTFIATDSLLKFAYGTASESIPELVPGSKKREINPKERVRLEKQNDCLIIPKAPVGRSGVRNSNAKSSAKTNAHLLVEFGLRLCFVLLKRDKLRDGDYKPFLDPFVAVFKNCLNSKHIKLSTLTLQCLAWVMKLELPSMKEHIGEIAKDMFAILHKYAAAGLSKGDNFDLVVAAFKAMAVLVRDVKYHTIEIEQLKILLLYTEQDMHDHDRQATAFNLLKAIISRKLIVPEIHEVMTKVAELGITSELNHVRAQSRAVFHQYLMDYPLGDMLEKHLSFYLSQMSYELQFGRESAIEMVQTLINSFPMKTLKQHSGTLLITLGARLVNDDVPECRKSIADCISSMLTKLSKTDREPLFDVIALWFRDKNVCHRRLAAQLCGIFVTVEKSSFETRLAKFFPLILQQFGLSQPKSGPLERSRDAADDSDEFQRVKDHHLFQVLQMLLKICAQCPSFLKRAEIKDLSQHIQKLLGYPHEWVRLSAAQFLGFVLSTTDIEHLATLVASSTSDDSGKYLHSDPVASVKSLTLDLCDQLQPGTIKNDLAEQVIKNLVFIAQVLQKIPIKEGDKSLNLLWLTKRMRKIVNTEVVETPTAIVLRSEVFKWIAGVGTVLELDSILPVLNHLLAPLVREMITTEESNAPLRQLSKEVANLLKKRVGIDVYTSTLSNLQQTLSVKRAERKRARTQLAVTDPEVFAKKKIKRHEKKKESKKRKIADRKGKKNFKRRKVVDLEPDEIL